jgi:hypothetical protein
MRAEGASQKPVNSGVKEHAACKDLMIPKVLPPHMEHERGGFKVKDRMAGRRKQNRFRSFRRSRGNAEKCLP